MNPPPLSEDEIRKIIFNPAYTGLGDYPAVVDEDAWIKAASRAMKEVGTRRYLEHMLRGLRASFPRGGEASFALGGKDKLNHDGPWDALKPFRRAEENTPYEVREKIFGMSPEQSPLCSSNTLRRWNGRCRRNRRSG
jgi:hypothetical protein